MSPLRRDRDGDRLALYAPPWMTPPDPHRAQQLWAQLQETGGLVSTSDLRERWGAPGDPLSKAAVQEYLRKPGCPTPVVQSGRVRLWLWAELEAWRAAYLARPGKPGPAPRSASTSR